MAADQNHPQIPLDSGQRVLFIRGLRDDKTTTITRVIGNNQLVYSCEGNAVVFEYIENDQFNAQLITLDANPEQNLDLKSADIGCIFNLISSAGSHQIALSKVSRLSESLGAEVALINHPSRIKNLTRERLHTLLRNIEGIKIPQTIALNPESAQDLLDCIASQEWSHPVIIRSFDATGRGIAEKLTDPTDANSISRFYYRNTCNLSPFINFADRNGIYRKLRLVYVGGELILRHVLYSDHWLVDDDARKNYMKKNSWLFDTEKRLLEDFNQNLKPRIEQKLMKVCEVLGLDYYAIDCAVDDDDNLIIFKISPELTILQRDNPSPNTRDTAVDNIRQQLIKMISSKLIDQH